MNEMNEIENKASTVGTCFIFLDFVIGNLSVIL